LSVSAVASPTSIFAWWSRICKENTKREFAKRPLNGQQRASIALGLPPSEKRFQPQTATWYSIEPWGMTHLRNALVLSLTVSAALFRFAGPSGALDVPVQGRHLSMRASDSTRTKRLARLLLRDAAIATPLPDPRTGAGLLLSGGVASDRCKETRPADA
jgi:hypothetical protein